MDLAAPHAGYVVAAYAISALVLVALAGFIIIRDRRLRAGVKALELPPDRDAP